jgi:hypothetical protein
MPNKNTTIKTGTNSGNIFWCPFTASVGDAKVKICLCPEKYQPPPDINVNA